MDPVTKSSVVKFGTAAIQPSCWVEATVTEHLDLERGDSVVSVTFNQIYTMSDGQMIAPKTLTVLEFRALVAAATRHQTL